MPIQSNQKGFSLLYILIALVLLVISAFFIFYLFKNFSKQPTKITSILASPKPSIIVANTPLPTLPGTIGNQIYWGGWIAIDSERKAPLDSEVWNTFEKRAGKKTSIIHSGASWTLSFNTASMNSARDRGNIPMFDWLPTGAKLKDITAGKYDSTIIIPFAEAAKSWGHPLFLRFAHQMNGNWYSWGTGQGNSNGNTPQDYTDAWKHVHQVFDQAYVKTPAKTANVTWIWCPSVTINNMTSELTANYPGDNYVDWVCLDGYNPVIKDNRWESFSQIIKTDYDSLTQNIAPNKPLMIGGIATQDKPTGDTDPTHTKPQWISDMLNKLPTDFPKIKALVWFNWNDGDCAKNWPIQGVFDQAGCSGSEDLVSETAFKAGINLIPSGQTRSYYMEGGAGSRVTTISDFSTVPDPFNF